MGKKQFVESFEIGVQSAFNGLLSDVFQNSLEGTPETTFLKGEIRAKAGIYKPKDENTWVMQKFRVGGINSDIFTLYHGWFAFHYHAFYQVSEVGTVLPFSIPRGFLIPWREKKNTIPLTMKGDQPDHPVANPLMALLNVELENHKKSTIGKIIRELPEQSEYQAGRTGIQKLKYKFGPDRIGIEVPKEYSKSLEMTIYKEPMVSVIPRYGKTIVSVRFSSFMPSGRMKGVVMNHLSPEGKHRDMEIGVPYGNNFASAYKILRYFQDLPKEFHSDSEAMSVVPRDLPEFLSYEIARQKYMPESNPLGLEEYIMEGARIEELYGKITADYGHPEHVVKDWNRRISARVIQ
ncbi:MAG: hypothetical protein ACW98Y_11275 [Candidatus Thorarchaeota archaeon]|jgi:hypothetical protein